MCRLQESFEHKFPLILKFTKHRSLRIADAAPVLGEQHFPSPGLLAKSYRGTISSFSAGMVWIAFLSSLKCEVTISGGTRRIHWLREKSTTSLALNISRNTRSVSPVFSTLRISPPVVRLVGAIASILKVYWTGDCTFCPPTAALSSANDFGKSAGKM